MTNKNLTRTILIFGTLLALAACNGGKPTGGNGNTIAPGQTDFTNEELGGGQRNGNLAAPEAAGAADNAADGKAAPPSGRMGDVQEGDIYKIAGDKLFYLNTYRGFVIYDVADTKKPVRLSRLPVFGYPIEMFVQGNTVYALLADALYLTGARDALKFERHNVSQLVAIDITDVRNPRVLQTVDIIGELREGVSRKIENTIYVVSNIPQYYSWGWRYSGQATPPQKEQAWVYSFNVANPQAMQLVQKLQVFEGGSVNFNDPQLGIGLSRSFQSVAISATSNALMVVENWYISSYSNGPVAPGGQYRCGSYSSDQQAKVTIVDISDPTGVIRIHTQFDTAGGLHDQFKMTYVHDDQAGTGTFYGIFARQGWTSANCGGTSFVDNVIESWDVTDGQRPALLSSLTFGKKDETVRGSAFDVSRNVAFAITARRIDPLYAIDLSNRNSLKILSAIDGLSGDMSVFRLIAGNGFLMGIGTDTSDTCTGFQDITRWRPTNIAVSLIDVRNLSDIRLVQRQCVAVENADWIGSDVSWNMDQAHKMIGMHSDGTVNVVTVPIYYSKRTDENNWWWYSFETAVGVMSWDLTGYIAGTAGAAQNVLTNHGTVLHADGQVRRSIVWKHEGTGRRMMINLSDTHVSLVDLQDLAAPKLDAVIELAPYYSQIFGFGDHIVEHVQASPYYGGADQGASEFRIKPAGGDLDATAAIATLRIGQVTRVLKHGSSLLLFRAIPQVQNKATGQYVPPTQDVVVMDLSDPTRPKFAGSTPLPQNVMPYYTFWCGNYGGGFWFDAENNWVETGAGVVLLSSDWDDARNKARTLLSFIDLREPGQPRVQQTELVGDLYDQMFGLVADPVDPSGFYLSYRDNLGMVMRANQSFGNYKYFTQRFALGAGGWVPGTAINLPGRLVRTWAAENTRFFLTQDYVYRQVLQPDGMNTYWQSDFRLNLLQESKRYGRPLASLLDTHSFVDMYLQDLVTNGDQLFVNASKGGYWGRYGFGIEGDVAVGVGGASDGVATPTARAATLAPTWEDYSDRIIIFDLSGLKLRKTFDQPTATTGVRFMGINRGHLFVNLPGDGVLAVDISNPAAPAGRQFLRTLGYASHIEFAGNTAYIAAGYFGVYNMTLVGPRLLAVD